MEDNHNNNNNNNKGEIEEIKEDIKEEEAPTSITIILPAPTLISPSRPSYNSSTTSTTPSTYPYYTSRLPYAPYASYTLSLIPIPTPALFPLNRDTILSTSLSFLSYNLL